jgi:hypothetical protein
MNASELATTTHSAAVSLPELVEELSWSTITLAGVLIRRTGMPNAPVKSIPKYSEVNGLDVLRDTSMNRLAIVAAWIGARRVARGGALLPGIFPNQMALVGCDWST